MLMSMLMNGVQEQAKVNIITKLFLIKLYCDNFLFFQLVFIKDILLTQDLQVALSSAAKEKRLAASKLISARADVEAAKLMRESADILNTRPAMQIRYLETIQEIAKKPSPKLVFLPFDENAGTN
eukprot:TRINITY_DN4329_c0_g2_i2.p3 TRINITY_DN4329_c0_g2~~TRINITY_DN4329_c0_g2_i2.p3  ORF type:complete len:125 (-),score=23.54 TRINITY_DN4329_c0_g2_i2:203-577(-)